jgi:hypothetical protein
MGLGSRFRFDQPEAQVFESPLCRSGYLLFDGIFGNLKIITMRIIP